MWLIIHQVDNSQLDGLFLINIQHIQSSDYTCVMLIDHVYEINV